MSETFVTMINKTEGRDKLLKASAGFSRMISTYTNNKSHEAMAKSMSEARSLLRMVSWFNNMQRMKANELASSVDQLMFVRVLLDAVYVVHDNLAYFTKYKVLNFSSCDTLAHRGLVGLFWGFFVAVIVDLQILLSMSREALGEGYEKARRLRLGMLVRDLCDMVAGLSQVGYAGNFLGPRGLGFLGFVSASISCGEIWSSCSKSNSNSPKKKE